MKPQTPVLFRSAEQERRSITADTRKLARVSPLHWHRFIEVEIVLDGEGVQILNGSRIPLHRGMVSVLRLTDHHQIEPAPELTLLNVSLDEQLLPQHLLHQLWSDSTPLCHPVEPEAFAAIEGIAGLIAAECLLPTQDMPYLQHLLQCLFRKWLGPRAWERSALPPFQQALAFVRSHFRDNPSLAQAAAQAHYHPNHFSALFHREVGMTYTQYITRLKIDYAKQMLLSTRLNIDLIAMECGFRSPAHFRRVFRQLCQTSPGQYRQCPC